jgi:KDO2-lipid IV(A) lauroyltransferase
MSESWRRIQHRVGNQAFFALARTAGLLPLSALEVIGARLGDLVYHISPRHRGIVMANLKQALGNEKSPEELRAIARTFYRNLGRNLLEFLHLPQMSDEEIERRVTIQGREHIQRGIEAGKGVIMLTAHYGNWELAGAKMVLAGYPLNVIAREQADPMVTHLMMSLRRGQGMKVIPRDHGLRQGIRQLRKNEIVVFLLDQNAGYNGVFVDFFGRLASTHGGAAALAMITGAAVVPSFAIRNPDGTHTGIHYPAMEIVSTGDRDADIVANTAAMTKIIEREIRKHPEQWFWLHRRWKHRPPWERTEGPRGSARARRLHERER